MKGLQTILSTDFVTLILRLRHGSKILAVGWISLHGVFAYELISGKIKFGRGAWWFEARESAPMLYWFAIGLFAAVLIAVDVAWIRFTVAERRRMNKKV